MFVTKLEDFEGKKITKQFILDKITESDIFHRYIGIYPTNKPIKSPLRQDKHADCGFYVNKYNRIKFYDKAKGINEDCFGIVVLLYRLTFIEAVTKIADDFGLLDDSYVFSPYRDEIQRNIIEELKESITRKIEIEPRDFNKLDLDYWKQFNIDKELLEIGDCYAVKIAWINGTIHYMYKKDDPCYAYAFKGNETIKLYFPLRAKGKLRFYTMIDMYPLSGYDRLSLTGDYVIITKSWKDEYSIKSFGINNVCSVQSENGLLPYDLIEDLYNRFDNVFILYDWDLAGVKAVKRNIEIYPFLKPLFIKDSSKDFSGFVKKYGVNKTLDLINKFEEYIKQFIYHDN